MRDVQFIVIRPSWTLRLFMLYPVDQSPVEIRIHLVVVSVSRYYHVFVNPEAVAYPVDWGSWGGPSRRLVSHEPMISEPRVRSLPSFRPSIRPQTRTRSYWYDVTWQGEMVHDAVRFSSTIWRYRPNFRPLNCNISLRLLIVGGLGHRHYDEHHYRIQRWVRRHEPATKSLTFSRVRWVLQPLSPSWRTHVSHPAVNPRTGWIERANRCKPTQFWCPLIQSRLRRLSLSSSSSSSWRRTTTHHAVIGTWLLVNMSVCLSVAVGAISEE